MREYVVLFLVNYEHTNKTKRIPNTSMDKNLLTAAAANICTRRYYGFDKILCAVFVDYIYVSFLVHEYKCFRLLSPPLFLYVYFCCCYFTFPFQFSSIHFSIINIFNSFTIRTQAKNAGNYFIFSLDFFYSPSFCFIMYKNAGL